MADIESLRSADSELTSKFSSVFRDYFDLDGRDYSDCDTSSQSGSKKDECLLENDEPVPENMQAAVSDCGII